MSSSKENYIAIDDKPEVIKKKLQKSFCPQGQVEGNPVIEIAEHFIFTEDELLTIERPPKFGGNLELSYADLLDVYGKEELHPLDLKNAVIKRLTEILEPVRDYLRAEE